MNTRFPSQIDSFPVRLPKEVISSSHINDLQDAVVAIEVFVKAQEEALSLHTEQIANAHLASAIGLDSSIDGYSNVFDALLSGKANLNAHINQIVAAHAATAISVNSIPSIDTTNVQTALASLNSKIDTMEASDVDPVAFAAHLAANINSAHSGQLDVSTKIADAAITGNKIALNQITIPHLTFIPALASDLTAHETTNIDSAHPNGTFPIARLDTAVATSASLTAHTSASTGVHGLDAYSSVVGTLATQTLENKTVVSDFLGSKVILFTTPVTTQEKSIYNTSNPSANQLEVRQKSVATISAVNNAGNTIITVPDTTLFSDIVGVVNGIQFLVPPSTSILFATVSTILTGTTLQLDAQYFAINTSQVAINTEKAKPLFLVDPNGVVYLNELHVRTTAFGAVDFKDDVVITGSLTVSNATVLQSGLSVTGTTTLTGSETITGTLNVGSSATATSLISTGLISAATALTVGTTLTVSGNATLSQDLTVVGNEVVDGYLNVAGNTTFQGSLNISSTLDVGSAAVIAGPLTVAGSALVGSNLEVDGSLLVEQNTHLDGYLTVDGYGLINNNLTVTGNLIVNGSITTPASSFMFANGQVSPAPVTGLLFSSASIRGAYVEYTIYRSSTGGGATELSSVGTLRVISKPTAGTWTFDETYAGDVVGITFSIDNTGQVNYTSTTITGTIALQEMKYRTRTIEV